MAKTVLTSAYVLLNGVDLSDHVESVTLDVKVTDVDVTAMKDGGHVHIAGLQDSQLTLTFWQDYAASNVDATMWAIVKGGTAVAFKVGNNGSSFSATNPSYSGSVLLTDYQPLAGKVGDGLQAQVTMPVCGTVTSGTS
jgi:hypothetical protein